MLAIRDVPQNFAGGKLLFSAIGRIFRTPDLRRKIAETEAYISRAAQRRGYALVTTEDYVAAVDRLYALKLDLAGSEWKVEDILIKRLADHGIYTAANLQLFRRQP